MLKDFQLVVAATIIGVSLIVASRNLQQSSGLPQFNDCRYSFHREDGAGTYAYVFDKWTGKVYQWSFNQKTGKVQYVMRDLIRGEDHLLNQ